jgi:hypothetical protein
MSDLMNDRLHAMFTGAMAQADGADGESESAESPETVQENTQVAAENAAEGTQLAQTAQSGRPPAADPRFEALIRENERLKAQLPREQPKNQPTEQDLADAKVYRDLQARKDYDPVGVAEHFGYKPDEYALKLREMGAMTPERRELMEHKRELAEMRAWKQEITQQQTQSQVQQREQQAFQQLKDYASKQGDKYDTVLRSDIGLARVAQVAQEHYARNGSWPALDDTLSLVENELLDKTYAHLYDSPKIRARITGKSGSVAKGRSAPEAAGTRTGSSKMSEDESLKAAGEMLLRGFRRG